MLALPVGLSSVMAASSLPGMCMFGLARIPELLVMEQLSFICAAMNEQCKSYRQKQAKKRGISAADELWG